jgi:hypothetical protein
VKRGGWKFAKGFSNIMTRFAELAGTIGRYASFAQCPVGGVMWFGFFVVRMSCPGKKGLKQLSDKPASKNSSFVGVFKPGYGSMDALMPVSTVTLISSASVKVLEIANDSGAMRGQTL